MQKKYDNKQNNINKKQLPECIFGLQGIKKTRQRIINTVGQTTDSFFFSWGMRTLLLFCLQTA